MSTDKHNVIGVDIGGTKIAFVLIDSEGNAIQTIRVPTQLSDEPELILSKIGQQINLLACNNHSEIMGIGIAAPGLIDPQNGVVKNAVNLNWNEVGVIDEVRKSVSLSVPIYMQRDTAAETLGEYYFGAGRDCQNFVFLGIGTGFGAGALTSGHLLTGANNQALEIGHLSIDRNGPACGCGNRGCIETLLSGNGLINRATALYAGSNERNYDVLDHSITTDKVISLADDHDPIAESLIHQMAGPLGLVCAILKTVLSPEKIIIGGGLGKALFDYISGPAEAEMNLRTLRVDDKKYKTGLVKSNLETSAMGAAAMVWYFNDLLPEIIKQEINQKEAV